jgi:hypothetical protein
LRSEIQQIVPAVLHEVKERAVVDKPITEAEVVALLDQCGDSIPIAAKKMNTPGSE